MFRSGCGETERINDGVDLEWGTLDGVVVRRKE